jgi:predicted HTH domain antitoxin
MRQVTVKLPDELFEELQRRGADAERIVELGLRQLRMEEALTLFREGSMSIWRAARLARVGLRDMMLFAASRGVRPRCDPEMLAEELR